jgi:hypothetical protein
MTWLANAYGRDRTEGGTFTKVVRIALTQGQVAEFALPPLPGKASDSRAKQFEDKYGKLVQVELDALPPDQLRALYQAEIDRYWDMSAYEGVRDREATERAWLRQQADGYADRDEGRDDDD